MKIEELLKLQEENKLPTDIIDKDGARYKIVAVNQNIAMVENTGFFLVSELLYCKLAPETIHIEAYVHIFNSGTQLLQRSDKYRNHPSIVKTIDLSRDVEKTW